VTDVNRTPPLVWAWIGDVDAADAVALTCTLHGLLDEPTTTLVIDLAGVTFLDCAALSVLIRANNEPSTHLLLQSAPTCVHRLLELTGLTTAFSFIADGEPLFAT
jgi:anti-anti-sigma factor